MAESPPKTIKFDYIKSGHFRVVHADGVFGGITPSGNIHVDIWSERPPIPKHIEHEFVDGELGRELAEEREIRDANVIREVEIGITFNLELAKATIKWLTEKVEALEGAIKKSGAINANG